MRSIEIPTKQSPGLCHPEEAIFSDRRVSFAVVEILRGV
jgi:hypothetical protein